jgi:tRNA dimethylallyltransferase
LAIEIALRLGAEIISVDSMQVYRGMDIGTAKPTLIERQGVPHHLIDIVDPDQEFSVAEFRRLGKAVIEGTEEPVIIVGGSGLHFRALVDPMSFAPTDASLRRELEAMSPAELVAELTTVDADAARHVDIANRRRVLRAVEVVRLTGETPTSRAASAEAGDLRRYVAEESFTAVGVDPGNLLEGRVKTRLGEMRRGGLVEEVARLDGRLGRTARAAVGYREILRFLRGDCSEDEAFESISRNTKKLAKKQRTWFQRDPRIQWIPWMDDETARVERVMEKLT